MGDVDIKGRLVLALGREIERQVEAQEATFSEKRHPQPLMAANLDLDALAEACRDAIPDGYLVAAPNMHTPIDGAALAESAKDDAAMRSRPFDPNTALARAALLLLLDDGEPARADVVLITPASVRACDTLIDQGLVQRFMSNGHDTLKLTDKAMKHPGRVGHG